MHRSRLRISNSPRRRVFRLAGACASSGICASAFAQSGVSFVGASGGFWHNPANWQPMVVPDNIPNAMPPVFYTVSIDRNVLINGTLFDIAGMTNTGQVDTFTSWDFVANGAPFLLNTGTFSIIPISSASAYVGIPPGQTLVVSGGGMFRLGGAGLARVLGGGTLINQDNTIRGEGSFGEGVLTLVNNGVIAATDDNLSDGTLSVFPGPGGLTNTNTLQARNMGNLLLRGAINNTGGTIVADGGGTVHFVASPQITGGTISSEPSGRTIVSSTTRWINLAHSAETFVPATLDIVGAIENSGSLNVSGSLRVDTSATLDSDGTVILTGGGIARAGANPATLLNSNTVRGSGSVGTDLMTITNADEGQFIADGGTLTLNPSNDGVFANSGTFLSINGAQLTLTGAGSFNNAGGNIHAAPNSSVRLAGARISGGSLSSGGNGTLTVPTASTARLTNVDINARVDVASGGVLEMENNIGGGSGTLELRGGATMRIISSATVSLGNVSMRGGSIVTAGALPPEDGPDGGVIFYNNATIRGAGTIGVNNLQIINNGAIRADGGGVGMSTSLAIDPNADGVLNAGVLEAIDLGVLILNGGTGQFMQTGGGVIRATDPGSNVQLINAFVSGGQLGAGGGSITCGGGAAVTLDALVSDANLVQAGVGELVISQNVVNTGTITTPGVASAIVSSAATLNSASGFHVNQGTIAILSGGFADFNFVENASTLSLGRILLATNAQLMAHSVDQGTLSIAANSFATLKSSFVPGADGSVVNNLSIGSMGAAMDVTNRGMAVNYSGASPLATIRTWIESGYASGAWTGFGIRSSSAAANPGFGVGYAEASAIGSPATFLGRAIDSTTALFRYTRLGDADLNGIVNIADFSRLASAFNTAAPWSSGNFNYDALVNIADFSLLAANFNLSVPAPPARPGDVPEATTGLIAILAAGAMPARRRRRR